MSGKHTVERVAQQARALLSLPSLRAVWRGRAPRRWPPLCSFLARCDRVRQVGKKSALSLSLLVVPGKQGIRVGGGGGKRRRAQHLNAHLTHLSSQSISLTNTRIPGRLSAAKAGSRKRGIRAARAWCVSSLSAGGGWGGCAAPAVGLAADLQCVVLEEHLGIFLKHLVLDEFDHVLHLGLRHGVKRMGRGSEMARVSHRHGGCVVRRGARRTPRGRDERDSPYPTLMECRRCGSSHCRRAPRGRPCERKRSCVSAQRVRGMRDARSSACTHLKWRYTFTMFALSLPSAVKTFRCGGMQVGR